MKNVIVIGAGASGMMAAITAASEGASVTVLEGMQKPGRKLLLTGSGRCNLTSMDPNLINSYHSCELENAQTFTDGALNRFSVNDTIAFFRKIGLPCTAKDIYVYPESGQAHSVLQILLREMKRLGVKVKFQTKVKKIYKDIASGQWNVEVEGWTYTCDSVVVCCGSKAAAATGSDGSGYMLAQLAGHSICPITPALTALMSDDKCLQFAAGARSTGNVKAVLDGHEYTERGEIQWNKDSISGIAVFQLSAVIGRYLLSNSSVSIHLDLVPDWNDKILEDYLQEQMERGYKEVKPEELLCGILPDRVIRYLTERFFREFKQMAVENKATGIVSILKNLRIKITGVRDYDQAQICAGGVSVNEIRPDTLESKIEKNLYFAGEIMDIDGPCGGYNLQWAWSSGYTAGFFAAKN